MGSPGRPKLIAAALFFLTLTIASCARKPQERPAEHPNNLLLVTIDTVRADHLGAYGFKNAETPNLDRLAREGIRFEHAESAVPLTLPSHATILSGLLPPHHGLRNNGAGSFPPDRGTLATDLRAAGYRTGAFVGSFVLDHRFGLARGFEVYDDEIPRDPAVPASLEAERPGSMVVDRALEWLSKEDRRPFFAWVHLYDAHAPYDPPEPFRTRHADALYDGEIASVDSQIGRLLEWIDRRDIASSTVVAVAADHGESLGEHGEQTHGFFVYEATLHVPLILRIPEFAPAGAVLHTPLSLADLAPTLAGILGHPLAKPETLDGRDLSAFVRAGTEPHASDIYSESEYAAQFGWAGLAALRRGELKFIKAPRPELYDMRDDPGETRNRYAADAPRSDLLARIASFRKEEREAEPVGGTSETARKLASLGYLAGRTPAVVGGSSLSDPKDVLPLFVDFDTAHIDEMAGRLAQAGRRLLALTEKEPNNSVFADAAARVFRKKGDLAQAIRMYRRAVAANPLDLDARYDLAVALNEAGRTSEARAEIEEAIRRHASHAGAHNALGVVLSSEGRTAEALSEFEHAVALDPRDPQAQNNRGNALRAAGRLAEAQEAYQAAIAASPACSDAWNGLGTLEVERKRPREALLDFDRAISLSPRFGEAELNRAIALELAGDLDGAAAAYRQILDAARTDPNLAPQRVAAGKLLARLSARR